MVTSISRDDFEQGIDESCPGELPSSPNESFPCFFFSYIDQIHSKRNRGLLVMLLQVIVRRSFAFPPTSRQTFVSNTPKDDGLNTFSGAVH